MGSPSERTFYPESSPGLRSIDQHIPGAFPTASTADELESVGAYGNSLVDSSCPRYLPDDSEFPSTEVPSGSPIGVGSLPGKTSEPAVAALPEEKAGRREHFPPATTHSSCHKGFNAMTVPDSGPMSRARVSGGVGSLPGTPGETDVVRLPEERFHSAEISSRDSHAPAGALPCPQPSSLC